jgi:hypothetical protein
VPDYANEKDSFGWQPFNVAQQEFTKLALNYISTLIDITFSEINSPNNLNTLSFANNTNETGGYARFPDLVNFSGNDVLIDKDLEDGSPYEENLEPKDGTFSAYIWIHEIGHALGLKHPHGEPHRITGDTATPPYLPDTDDNTAWTVMSYNHSPSEYYIKYSPLDIAALHYLYGPSPASRAGNDTYTFDPANANFIWDGAGTDTIDASGAEEKVTVYLEPGYWGFKGEAKAETITSNGQITVNFGTKIENLIGSSSDDHLVGNELNNLITGGEGSDSLDGAKGIDTAVYLVDYSGITLSNFVDYGSSGGTIQLGTAWNIVSGNETDTLRNIERLKFNDKYIALDLDGNAGNTVKLLAALLGKESATNKTYIGMGLNLLDNGMSYEELMKAGLDVVFGSNPSGASVVDLLYKNLVGSSAPQSVIDEYGGMLDNGSMTATELGIAVADHSLNATNIDLVGLAQTGVEYILYG